MELPAWLDPISALLVGGGTALLVATLGWFLLRRWATSHPIRRLLDPLATGASPVQLFLRGMFVPGNEFFSRAPEYPPGAGVGVTVHKWLNITDVHSASDVRAGLEILQLLIGANPRLTVTAGSADGARMSWNDCGLAVGVHYKAIQILETCEPRLVAFRNPDAFRSLISQEIFEAKPGADYGLIYKGRHAASHRTFWVVMGLSEVGTQAAARFLRVHARLLGQFVGAAPFAAIVGLDPAQGLDRATLRSLQPRPSWWRRLFYRRRWQQLMGAPTGRRTTTRATAAPVMPAKVKEGRE
jgi:hypothetical protein